MMRRFPSDAVISSVDFPETFRNDFDKIFDDLQKPTILNEAQNRGMLQYCHYIGLCAMLL